MLTAIVVLCSVMLLMLGIITILVCIASARFDEEMGHEKLWEDADIE